MCHLALPKEQSVPLKEQQIEIISFFDKNLIHEPQSTLWQCCCNVEQL
jgi:hypothetical protein